MNSKLIFDPIHGYIELPQICIKIIDTHYFQQLRHKLQLGAAYYVFPGASHNRFEHSIGTCYLAGQLIKQLKSNQHELNILDSDVELIMIAGLVHDIGHGPLSHLFDDIVIKEESKYKHHEFRSGLILEKIVKTYNINLSDDDIIKIKEYINPSINNTGYMYQIIANKLNNLDVDKFDYLMRDSKNIGLSYSIDCSRLIMQARVINNEICYPEKLIYSIYELFAIRYRLHREIYTHPCVQQIEYMFADVLKLSEPHYYITKSIYEMDKFIEFTDSIFNIIEFSNNPVLEDAKKLMLKIRQRKLYKYVGDIYRTTDEEYNEQNLLQYSNTLLFEDIIVSNITRGYTNSDMNPVDNISFYKLNELDVSFKLQKEKVSELLPTKFNEKITRVFCKNPDKYEEVKRAFDLFNENILFNKI